MNLISLNRIRDGRVTTGNELMHLAVRLSYADVLPKEGPLPKSITVDTEITAKLAEASARLYALKNMEEEDVKKAHTLALARNQAARDMSKFSKTVLLERADSIIKQLVSDEPPESEHLKVFYEFSIQQLKLAPSYEVETPKPLDSNAHVWYTAELHKAEFELEDCTIEYTQAKARVDKVNKVLEDLHAEYPLW